MDPDPDPLPNRLHNFLLDHRDGGTKLDSKSGFMVPSCSGLWDKQRDRVTLVLLLPHTLIQWSSHTLQGISWFVILDGTCLTKVGSGQCYCSGVYSPKAFVVSDNDRTQSLCLPEGFVYQVCKTGLPVSGVVTSSVSDADCLSTLYRDEQVQYTGRLRDVSAQ